jgi:hypothetical protein
VAAARRGCDAAGNVKGVEPEVIPLAERGRRAMASWVAQLPKQKPKPVVRHEGAVALVGDLLSPQQEEEINPPQERPSWDGEDRLRELSAASESIAEALKLIAPEISKARKEYSKLVAAQRQGEYQEISERVVDCARALGDAIQDHHAFLNELRLDAVSWRYFRHIDLTQFGSLNDDSSPLRSLILDALERGHVPGGKIPQWSMPISISQLQNLGD